MDGYDGLYLRDMCFRFLLLFVLWSSTCLAEKAIQVPGFVNIGNTQIGTVENFKFNIKNMLDRQVRIVQIHASCSCTDVKLNGTEMLAPEEDRSVSGKVQFPLKVGAYQTTVSVEYQIGSAHNEKAEIAIRGSVVSALTMDRTSIDFGEVGEDGRSEAAVIGVQHGTSGEEWDAIKLAVPSEYVDAKIADLADGTKRITVLLLPKGLPLGVYREKIAVKLFKGDKELKENASISLFARISGPLKALPQMINLGAVPPSKPLARLIALKSATSDMSGVVVKTSQNVTAKLSDVSNGEKRLELSIIPPAIDGFFIETVVVQDSKTDSTLRIPILGCVKTLP